MITNLTFWPEDNSSVCVSVDSLATVCRQWCDPSAHSDVVGVDVGSGEMHIYWCSTGRKKRVSVDAAIAVLLSLEAGTLLIGEWAHLAVAQTQRSLAQPFSERQLVRLYSGLKEKGITLKMFPHAHSGARAREWSAHHFPKISKCEKGDMNDAVALALFVKHCNEISLANPPTSFARCSRRDYGSAVVRRANVVLNAERTYGYSGKMFPHVVSLAREMKKKCGRPITRNVAVSIAALICGEIDGNAVLYVRNGRAPGAWMWARHVMKFSPFHHRGGIARSNLMRHAFRSFVVRHALRMGVRMKDGGKPIKFAHHSAKQKAARTSAMRAFRCAVINAYRVGVAVAESRGFSHFDPLSHCDGGQDGR